MTELDRPAAVRDALRAIAGNYSFTWVPGARELFAELDPARFAELGHNPTALLEELSDDELVEKVSFERLERVLGLVEAESQRRTWWQRGNRPADFCVAYFSCEFGLDDSLPIYSGGLGVLSGDHLKSASELGIPLVGVGLFYRRGYFRQQLDEHDRQIERYPNNDPELLPLELEPVTVEVDLVDDDGLAVPVKVAARRAQVGRVPLYLLDTDIPGNPPWARAITDRLYGGDRRHRIRQELVLGIGGVKMLRALMVEASVFHLNEGHSAFLQLERMRELVEDSGLSRDAALQRLRCSTVFTTHTPVPAGNEVFDAQLVEENVRALAERCGFGWEEFLALGRVDPGEDGFGLTPFALRTSARANAVSQLHGEVAREMWERVPEANIVAITNGVHAPTWISPEIDELLGREEDSAAPDFARAYDVDGEALWAARRAAKQRLVEQTGFDPEMLTIGFARRFATYKRAGLLFRDPDRLAQLPVQIVFAGKAHPADEGGKDLIQHVHAFSRDPRVAGRVAFVADYEMAIARTLVQGVDVWLNNPRRPLEASGTSGMKAALNGVLNCSILDGWWAEAYSPEVGFAVGDEDVSPDEEEQDVRDMEALFQALEQQVIPAFHEREHWLQLMRNSIARLGARFSTDRMVIEYAESMYIPAHQDAVAQPAAA